MTESPVGAAGSPINRKSSTNSNQVSSNGQVPVDTEAHAVSHQPVSGIELCRRALVEANFDHFRNGVKIAIDDVYQRQAVNAKLDRYNILILFDEERIHQGDADRIYEATLSFTDTNKPLLLVLHSYGGSISAGYNISKLCREMSDGRFIAVVPRSAKSAATLICCGASEVHMGSLSELGPIDPQINHLPALGLKSSVDHIAELASKYPGTSDMFATYLVQTLKLEYVGFYERVAESAQQYAQRLLESRGFKKDVAERIAKHLVYEYKDHAFVVDAQEARSIFGEGVIVKKSPEFLFGYEIYRTLSTLKALLAEKGHSLFFTGGLGSEPNIYVSQ